jgi:hypothetical protein
MDLEIVVEGVFDGRVVGEIKRKIQQVWPSLRVLFGSRAYRPVS